MLDRRRPRDARTRALALANADPTLAILASCALAASVAERRTTWGASISSPLLAMGLGMALATCGIVPPVSSQYDLVWTRLMPLAVALTLLGVNVRDAASKAGPVLRAFVVGAVGSVLGAVVAFAVVGAGMGEHAWRLASCLCASYVGGSLNYAATAQALGLSGSAAGQAALAAGMAADNLAMAGFLAVIGAVPAAAPAAGEDDGGGAGGDALDDATRSKATPATIAAALTCALLLIEGGKAIAAMIGYPGAALGVTGVLAPAFAAAAAAATSNATKIGGGGGGLFRGGDVIGGALMLVFFAALGAAADPRVAVAAGGPTLAFIAIQLCVHLATCFVVGWKILQLPTWAILTASNANVGGPATAAATAAARGWSSATQPAVIVGTIGYAIGTPLGLFVGQLLRVAYGLS